jgi:carbamoyl-phosphate synthase large subunit
MHKAKKQGFSDKQIAKAVNSTEDEVRARRKNFGITPFVKRIDSMYTTHQRLLKFVLTVLSSSRCRVPRRDVSRSDLQIH